MKPAAFQYHRPDSLNQALDMLSNLSDAKLIAGGVSLAPVLNMRLARPAHLIDISRLSELDSVTKEGDTLRIGALVRHHQIAESPLVGRYAPLLQEAAGLIGHMAIRNRGTIGGSIAHADPAAELPVALTVLGGSVTALSAGGSREIPASELFLSYFTTSLMEGEILTEVAIPVQGPETGWAFLEFARRSGDFAITSVACQLRFERGSKRIAEARLVLGGVDMVPYTSPSAEAALVGSEPSDELFNEVGRLVSGEIDPPSDAQASADYRRRLAAGLTAQALRMATIRGGRS